MMIAVQQRKRNIQEDEEEEEVRGKKTRNKKSQMTGMMHSTSPSADKFQFFSFAL